MNPTRRRESLYDAPELATEKSFDIDVPERQLYAFTPDTEVPPLPRLQPYVAPEATRSSLGEVLADAPMGVWKRLAVYPGFLWALMMFFVPCRVNGWLTLQLLGLSALGIVGACFRLQAHGLD